MADVDLSVIIVNWNATDRLSACLQSVAAERERVSLETIVVDNASEDNCAAMVADRFPWVRLILNHRNEGFARANNQGFAEARGAFILILNPDARLRPGAVARLLATMQNRRDAGLAGPRIVDASGVVVPACRRPHLSLWQIAKGLFLTDQLWRWLLGRVPSRRIVQWRDRRYRESGPAACLQGSCMLARRTALEETGWFDERVPMYLDDGDLCRRMAIKGWAVCYVAEAEAVHEGAVSVNRMVNTRMSSMVGALAIDAYFLKYAGLGTVAAYHAMLFFSSWIFLAVDLLLWPPLYFINRRFIREYTVKHWHSLVYSVTFGFHTRALPAHWPRSILAAYRNDRGLGGGLPLQGRGRWP